MCGVTANPAPGGTGRGTLTPTDPEATDSTEEGLPLIGQLTGSRPPIYHEPAKPSLAPVLPTSPTAATRAAIAQQKKDAAKRIGPQSSIMTGSLGLESGAQTDKKRLLSGVQK